MEPRYKSAGPATLEASTGRVKAVFSTFDIVDRSGDIVRRSAFKDGQHVPLVWSHDWSKPIGRGIVRVEPSRAVFDGRFFMSTTAGREAYEVVKEMAELGEWSWGFRITKTQPNRNIQGMDIIGADVFEVSPVLVGANPATETLEVKAHGPRSVAIDVERARLDLEELALGVGHALTDADARVMLESERLDLEAIGLR